MCRDHTLASHEGQNLKVTKFQNRGVSGYLECRLCGHLTPGFVPSKPFVNLLFRVNWWPYTVAIEQVDCVLEHTPYVILKENVK
jgi:hypothetical protein